MLYQSRFREIRGWRAPLGGVRFRDAALDEGRGKFSSKLLRANASGGSGVSPSVTYVASRQGPLRAFDAAVSLKPLEHCVTRVKRIPRRVYTLLRTGLGQPSATSTNGIGEEHVWAGRGGISGSVRLA